MIDLNHAYTVFDLYVKDYDLNIPLIKLKVVHTYQVVNITKQLCSWLNLNEEDSKLAMLIALLHDIGRFKQYNLYHSYVDYQTEDHAIIGCNILFKEGLIRNFIEDNSYDDIIYKAILNHNKYKPSNYDKRIMMFIYLIRDADKLDNFRVKETESIETLYGITLKELQEETISDKVYNQFINNELIYGPNRNTNIDRWISSIAFIYDLYYQESLLYIKNNNWIDRSFDQIKPVKDPKYEKMHQHMLEYITYKL